MRRLLLLGLLWLFCLGSIGGCGSGSEDTSGEKKDVHKRTRRVPDPKKI
jgi:hypothetical protein